MLQPCASWDVPGEEHWRFWKQPREQLGFLAPGKLLKMAYMLERHLDVLLLEQGCPSTVPLPYFLCGGEGSPPFGAPAVRETPCTRSLGNSTAPVFSWQFPSLSQQAGKATLTPLMEQSAPVAAAA